MKRVRNQIRLLVLAIVLIAILAGDGQAAEVTATATNRSIALRLVDAVSGEPVPGAWLRAFPQGSPAEASARSDQNGDIRVLLPALPTLSRWTISIQPSNHVGRTLTWSSRRSDVLENIPARHTVKLNRPISLGGFVRDASGRPISGAQVIHTTSDGRLFGPSEPGFAERDTGRTPRMQTHLQTVTDPNGFWSQAGFSPEVEALWVNVRRPDGAVVQFASRDQIRPEMDWVVELPMKDLRATNAVLTLPEGKTLAGIVVDENGRPIPGVRLIEHSEQQSLSFSDWALTNGPDGRFALPGRAILRGRLSAEASGRAINSVEIKPAHAQEPIRLVLSPAQPVSLRVLDAQGEPVAGATVQPAEWRMPRHIVPWTSMTDFEGRVAWSNAPLDEVVLRVLAANHAPRSFRVNPTNRNAVVRLLRDSEQGIALRLRAVEEGTGQPIPRFEVFRSEGWARNAISLGQGSNGVFQSTSTDRIRVGLGQYRLQVQAPGYRDWSEPGFFAEDGDQDLTVALSKLKPRRGLVVQPDGGPAVNALVTLNTTEELFQLGSPADLFQENRRGKGMESQRTPESGLIELRLADDNQMLLITHPSGHALLRVGDWPAGQSIVLQPWARIEGTLRYAGKPLAGETIFIRNPIDLRVAEHFWLSFQTRTRPDGRFTFTNLFPGDHVLYRPQRYFSGAPAGEYYRLPISLRAGESNQLDYTLGGRTVTGQLVAEQSVDWKRDPFVLTRPLPPPPNPNVTGSDMQEYRRALRAAVSQPAVQDYERRRQQFQLTVEADGSFHAIDVPPGPYELRAAVARPPPANPAPGSSSFNRATIGTLVTNVVVPAGAAATEFDLGLFELTLTNTPATPPAGPPLALNATTLKGRPFDLASLRGKPVVLLFWAAWAPQSQAPLAELGALNDSLDPDRAGLVTVNLDEEAAVAERGLKGLGLDRWTHLRLSGKARADVTERLEINTLPALVILNRDGVAAARDLQPKRVPAALSRLARGSPNN